MRTGGVPRPGLTACGVWLGLALLTSAVATGCGTARAEKRLQGPEAASELIDRQAREGCAAWYRTGGPSKGPWG